MTFASANTNSLLKCLPRVAILVLKFNSTTTSETYMNFAVAAEKNPQDRWIRLQNWDAPPASCGSRLELIFPDFLYEEFYADFC
jgi:hypothetical protein